MVMIAPGIQYVQVETPKDSADALRSDVAGFAGIFERGPVFVPRRVEDWGEQRAELGGYLPVPAAGAGQALSPLALYGFFQNGGGTAVVLRLGSRGMRAAKATFVDPATGARVGLAASSPGAWANGLELRLPLRPIHSRVLAQGFPAADPGLRAGDIVRVFDAHDDMLFGTLMEVEDTDTVELPSAALMKPPLVVEVIAPEIDLVIEGQGVSERIRRLSLRAEASNNVWRVLARGRGGPEWQAELPSAWLPLDEELELALAQQGPGASRHLRATLPAGWPDAPASPLGTPWAPPALATLDSARTGLLRVVLQGGDDALDGIDASAVQAAIAALVRSPLPSLIAIPDLVLPLTRRDPPCAKLPPFDARLPYPAPGVRGVVRAPPTGKLPSYGPSFEALQEQLLQAIWQTTEGRAERFALLDPAPTSEPADLRARAAGIRAALEREGVARLAAASGALFYPWLRMLDPALGGSGSVLVPPSGHIAGILARSSRDGGPGARFANESIAGAIASERQLSDDERADLNSAGVAAVHVVKGRGPTIFGVRTLSNERRPDAFIPGARVLAFVRRTLRLLGETLTFEPNDPLLLQRIRVSVDLVLRTLFRSGAFAGRTPAEAYAVRCDAVTSPPSEVALGRVIAEVDVALVVPLEFITLRVAFSRDGSGVQDDLPQPTR